MLGHSVGSMLRLKLTSLGTTKVVNCTEVIIPGGEFSAEFCTSVSHPMSKGSKCSHIFHQWCMLPTSSSPTE